MRDIDRVFYTAMRTANETVHRGISIYAMLSIKEVLGQNSDRILRFSNIFDIVHNGVDEALYDQD